MVEITTDGTHPIQKIAPTLEKKADESVVA